MASRFIDLRSDTVTRPTQGMRDAMAAAEVGDDCYGEDPTVNFLEATFAARVGKEAAVYVPSGTMANQIALRLHAPPGSLVIAPRRAHVVAHEAGAAAINSGVQFLFLHDRGTSATEPDPGEITQATDAAPYGQAQPSLLWLENTYMPEAGAPLDIESMRKAVTAARIGGLKVHLDGARLFNAEAATGISAAEYTADVDTVMCCLSKGLCAPVGSVLAGAAADMARARLERQRFGGGMRQAGVIAAAGVVALERMIDRLPEDHARARRLADAVAERWPDSGCDPKQVRTNIVTWQRDDAGAIIDHLASEGVRVGMVAPGALRLVTHHDIDDEGVDRAVKAISSAP